jgi:hypothetical protein
VEHSFSTTLPDSPVELLLADNSHAHLLGMATASPTRTPPGCGVDSPDQCPTARRAQVQCFGNGTTSTPAPNYAAAPTDPSPPYASKCRPWAAPLASSTPPANHTQLRPRTAWPTWKPWPTLDGARIGLLRVMAETQLSYR